MSGDSITRAIEQAVAYNEQGKTKESESCLDEIADLLPDDFRYAKLVGMIYQSLGADAKSLRLISRAAEVAPDDAELQLALGFHFMDNGEPDRSLGCFQQAVTLDSASLEALTHLGRAYDFQQEFQAAEEALRQACALDPSNADPAIHLGRILTRANRPAEACDVFSDILARLAPGNILAEMGLRRAKYLVEHGPAGVARSNAADPATVICVKQGTLYGADYVNRLAAMVRRNAESEVRFVCFTEDPQGIADGIEHHPLPAPGLLGWWNKVALFREDLENVGDRLLFLDLDVVITGSIEPLLRYESDFAVMDNDYVPGCNTSVVLFERGSRPEIWNNFSPEISAEFGGDQDWVALNVPDADLWPGGWCVPYRLRAAKIPPSDCRIVCFSGRPNPEDYPAPWIRDYWY